MSWIHGGRLYRDVVIEVEEVKSVRRGFPKTSLGWRAKLELPHVVIMTSDLRPTQDEAERLLIDVVNEWLERTQ